MVIRRWLGLAVVFCVVLVVLMAALAIAQQWMLRYRAERLLSDMQQLQLRQSTWADAQKLMQRWQAWGHADGACRQEFCVYKIEFRDVVTNLLWSGRSSVALMVYRIYQLAGCRNVRIEADLTVVDGLVWGKEFQAFVAVPEEKGPHEHVWYWLIGDAQSVSHFWGEDPELTLHKNYVIERPGGCHVCVAAYTRFTPYADAKDVQRLMEMDLSCITRRAPCREQQDIMPKAWKQYLAEQPVVRRQRSCGDYPLDVIGRDAENAAVVEVVTSQKARSEYGPFYRMQLRLERRLKDARLWEAGSIRTIDMTDDEPATPGTKFILIFDNRGHLGEPCGRIELTTENLAKLQAGIAEDFMARRQRN